MSGPTSSDDDSRFIGGGVFGMLLAAGVIDCGWFGGVVFAVLGHPRGWGVEAGQGWWG